MLPSAFTLVLGEVHTGFVWQPVLIAGPTSELRLGLCLGGGAMALWPTNAPFTARPSAAASVDLTWMLHASRYGSLGVRVSASEVMAFSVLNANTAPVHFATVNLAIVGDVGASR